MTSSSCFLTLTYDDEHLPEDRSLNLDHWQKFAKRVRHHHGPFRFLHCGEYGPKTLRPHYHALIFGLDFTSDRKLYKHTPDGHALYTSELLEETWGKGFAPIGELTFESAAYVARYCMKKVTGPDADAHYGGRKPEYTTMSRRPGIGHAWLGKFTGDVYPSDEVIVNGKSTRPPKFYDYLLEKEDEELLLELKAKRVQKARRHSKNNTPARLKTREHIQQLKAQKLIRPNN